MIVYTVITNDYDTLRDPRVVTPGWRYVCFSDQPIESDVWEFHKIGSTTGIWMVTFILKKIYSVLFPKFRLHFLFQYIDCGVVCMKKLLNLLIEVLFHFLQLRGKWKDID